MEVAARQMDAGKSLEQFFKGYFSLSKAQISSLKFNAALLVDGKKATMKTRLEAGSQITLEIPDTGSDAIWPVYGFVDVLYEDRYLLLVSKPAGMPCHPGRGHYFDTLANRVAAYWKTDQIHIFGRLDQDTSGIVCFARHGFVIALLEKLKEKGLWHKRYLALVQGQCPKSGTIEFPIAPVPDTLNRFQTSTEGMRAHTEYARLLAVKDASLVSITTKTGRTHQIRVHMAAIGHPLLQDPFYNLSAAPGRCMLHVNCMWGIHPITHAPLHIACPMPADMKALLKEKKM